MKKLRGLTILELMAVFAIIGIAATIAYPKIMDYLTQARRQEAETALLMLSSNMERYFAEHNTYSTATIGSGNQQTDIAKEEQLQNKYYKFSITQQSTHSFVISATPIKEQAKNDTACGTLTINEKGSKGISGNGDVEKCWKLKS